MPTYVTVTADAVDAEVEKLQAKLDLLTGMEFERRAELALHAAASAMVQPMKGETPVGPGKLIKGQLQRPGKLRASVKAKRLRKRSAEIAAAGVGPTAPHAHLVIRGTALHSLETKRSGKSQHAAFGLDQVRRLTDLPTVKSGADPFVDRAWNKHSRRIIDAIEGDVFAGVRDT